jgi:hypothetical protein
MAAVTSFPLPGMGRAAVAILDKARFGAMSMERPALVRTGAGRWRLYICSATPESKHWWIDGLEADDPAGLADAEARTVFGGDDRTAVKDPVVRVRDGRWHAWICCHPLDQPGEEDRMTTAYATSEDGLVWDWHGTALVPRSGTERTGLAHSTGRPGELVQDGGGPVSDARYLDVVPLPDGGYRLYYEFPLADQSHELRTELVPAT